MKIKKQHKSICFLLMISMLFLGMCFEDIEADSCFAYQLSVQTNSTLRSMQNTSLSHQSFTEETTIGQPVSAIIRQAAKRSCSRTGRNSELDLLSAEILWHNFPTFFTLSSRESGYEIPSNTVIVDYIHHKDGKKS